MQRTSGTGKAAAAAMLGDLGALREAMRQQLEVDAQRAQDMLAVLRHTPLGDGELHAAGVLCLCNIRLDCVI
jgi:hypothetical protein